MTINLIFEFIKRQITKPNQSRTLGLYVFTGNDSKLSFSSKKASVLMKTNLVSDWYSGGCSLQLWFPHSKASGMILKIAWIQRDKTMADKLMYIPNYNTQNYPLCRLQFVIETFGHST